MWRFAGNEDKEGIDMINAEETEEKQDNKVLHIDVKWCDGIANV